MMEVPDSLCVVLIGSQARLKGLSCAVPSRGLWAMSGISQQKEGVGAVMEAVIHFWTTGEPGCIILLSWFLSDFIGFANTSCFSPGKMLRLARGTITVPCVFPSHSHPSLESEQDACSWASGEELALLLELGRRWCATVAGSPWKPSTRTTDGQNQGWSQLVNEHQGFKCFCLREADPSSPAPGQWAQSCTWQGVWSTLARRELRELKNAFL